MPAVRLAPRSSSALLAGLVDACLSWRPAELRLAHRTRPIAGMDCAGASLCWRTPFAVMCPTLIALWSRHHGAVGLRIRNRLGRCPRQKASVDWMPNLEFCFICSTVVNLATSGGPLLPAPAPSVPVSGARAARIGQEPWTMWAAPPHPPRNLCKPLVPRTS